MYNPVVFCQFKCVGSHRLVPVLVKYLFSNAAAIIWQLHCRMHCTRQFQEAVCIKCIFKFFVMLDKLGLFSEQILEFRFCLLCLSVFSEIHVCTNCSYKQCCHGAVHWLIFIISFLARHNQTVLIYGISFRYLKYM